MNRLMAFITISLLLMLSAAAEKQQSKIATIYKTPGCGCCDGHADYLRKAGYKVTITASEKLDEINRKAGIPEDYQGCHTTFINGYAISGHVPIKPIEKLMSERPDIKGIALPGMPMGSPGMNGTKDETWKIYAIDKNGKATLFATE